MPVKLPEFLQRSREKDVQVASADRTGGQIRTKGIWTRFVHTCKVAGIPWAMMLLYTAMMVVEGVVLVKMPVVSGNFFAGDVSPKSIAMFIGVELFSTVIVQCVLYVNHILRYRMNRNMRNALWGKILQLKPSYYDQVSASTLLSRITTDADAMNTFVLDVILAGIYEVYVIVLSILEMNRISMRAGVMLLVFVPVQLVVMWLSGRVHAKFENRLRFSYADLTQYVSELVSCLPLMKAFNMQGYERRRGRKVVDEYARQQNRVISWGILRGVIGLIIGLGPTVCIFLMGIRFLNDGTMDPEGWYIFYAYAGTFIGIASTFGSYFERIKTVQGQLNKISDVLYEEEEALDGYVQQIVQSGDILFDEVTFAYEEEPVLKNASFTIPGGSATAVIGYSGSGKSTTLKLLERIYDPAQGRILMGGKDIRQYDIRAWRSSIAFVSQGTPLMSGTIRENVLYGVKEKVSDEQILQVAKLCHVDGFIRENPQGLDYQVGQFASKLSGGQKQKLSILRAILSGAKILILDEPTASLDIPSTQEIISAVGKLKGERTVIVVTHDEQMVRACDYVVEVRQDHTVWDGDHSQMQKLSPFYRQLVDGPKEP